MTYWQFHLFTRFRPFRVICNFFLHWKYLLLYNLIHRKFLVVKIFSEKKNNYKSTTNGLIATHVKKYPARLTVIFVISSGSYMTYIPFQISCRVPLYKLPYNIWSKSINKCGLYPEKGIRMYDACFRCEMKIKEIKFRILYILEPATIFESRGERSKRRWRQWRFYNWCCW